MIIWINGAFGVGKSHTSYELVRRLRNAFLFDPEQVGFFLRKYLPSLTKTKYSIQIDTEVNELDDVVELIAKETGQQLVRNRTNIIGKK